MSVDLVIPNTISTAPETVAAQNGLPSGLALATNLTIITGQDIVGSALPLQIHAQPTNAATWNRILRLSGPSGFFDLGIDSGGNFFINSPTSTDTVHVLTISPSGQVTIPNLVLTNLQTAPSTSTDLAVDSGGVVYRQ